MGRIFYLMGKSASGKDTIYKKVKEQIPELDTIVIYTTRPIRAGERDGVEYHFVDDKKLEELQQEGKVIELREYNTVHGIWKYFTADDGQFDPEKNLIAIGTLESYRKMRGYFGAERLFPIYIEVEDGVRLERALTREQKQENPKYEELCRRFLADAADFSEDKLKEAGITHKFLNTDLNKCLEEIVLGIKEKLWYTKGAENIGEAGDDMNGFKDVVGHKDIIRYIQNAVEQNKLSHAYILNGQRGSGKKLLANLFAMTLQCESGKSEPCGECRSCVQAKNGNQPDIITVKHEKPTSISVDDIREQLNDDIGIKPYSSPYKIYMIPEADLMTVQAQNALLKTLEEPPEYAVIFLLTENAESLLPTIRSRCVMLKLRNIKDELVKKYLMEQMQVPDYQAQICAAFAQGNIGRAVMLAKSEHFNEIKDDAIQLLKYIDEMELHEIVSAIKQINKYKLEVTDYLDIFSIWYRDILIYKATADVERLVFGDQLKFIREKANKSSYEGIETILTSIEKAKERLRANVNFDLLMELLLLTIKEN